MSTWLITGYTLLLFDELHPEPAGLVMTTVLNEHLGVMVESMGEDDWGVKLCAPWSYHAVHGLSKQEAFEAAAMVAEGWRRGIRIMMDKGRLNSLTHTPSDVMEEEVGNRGRAACNKVRDYILGVAKEPAEPMFGWGDAS